MGYDIYFGYRADAELDAALEPFLNDAALLSWDNTDKLAELFQVEFFKQHVYAEQLSLNYKACNVLFSMSGRELSVVS